MTLAERVALEQVRYWRAQGLTCQEMVTAIGDPHTLTPGDEEADAVEALALAWVMLGQQERRAV